jgi:hypothetical protein
MTPIAEMDNAEVFDLEAAMRRADHALTPGKKDIFGEAEGEVSAPEGLEQHNTSSTVILVKDIADILTKRYPGWAWAVQPDEHGGIINIFNLHLHTSYGFTIRMDDIMDDPRRRLATVAGHTILRRFRMPDRMNPEELLEVPRDLEGMCIPDISDFKSGKERDNAMIALKLATGEWSIVEGPNGKYLRKNR